MLDLKRQYASIKDDVAAAVERVLTTQYFIGGPELDAFERESAAYLGVRASLGCASGTDALWLALAAAGVQPGDRVITSAFTFFASASSITRCGAVPVFADVDPATLNIDPAAVEKLLAGPQPVRAVMPVHLYGQCADMDAFAALAQKHGVAIIEDAAQAFGANWRGKKAGTLGRAGAFSFYPTKNLSAYGDGGAVSTDDEDLAAHVRRLRNHGSRQRYYHEEIGWNSRLDALQAAVLRIKLQHIDRWNQQRREIAAKYDALFARLGTGEDWRADRRCPGSDRLVADAPRGLPHLSPVRGARLSPRRTARLPHRTRHRHRDLLPGAAASAAELCRSGIQAGRLAGLGGRRDEKRWRYPSSPSCATTKLQRVVAAIAEFYSR